MYPAYGIETTKDYVEALKKSGMKFTSETFCDEAGRSRAMEL